MTQPHPDWKVLPHGPLTDIGDGILCAVGQVTMPLVEIPRRMTVVPLNDGRLVVWSAIALDDAAMAVLQRHGRPAFLVVPSDHHRLDAAPWKARFPDLQVIAPAGSREKVAEVVAVDTNAPDFGDARLRFMVVPGTREKEAALVVHRPQGTTLVLNDIIGNIRHASGFGGWLLRRMGLAGDEAQVPTAVALLIVKDKQALGAQFLEWAAIPDLKRIIVSHGDIIDRAPAEVLQSLAHALV